MIFWLSLLACNRRTALFYNRFVHAQNVCHYVLFMLYIVTGYVESVDFTTILGIATEELLEGLTMWLNINEACCPGWDLSLTLCRLGWVLIATGAAQQVGGGASPQTLPLPPINVWFWNVHWQLKKLTLISCWVSGTSPQIPNSTLAIQFGFLHLLCSNLFTLFSRACHNMSQPAMITALTYKYCCALEKSENSSHLAM